MSKGISRPTLKRLPLYMHYLKRIQGEGVEFASSSLLASEFGFDPTQVRKDLAATGEVGIARRGFEIVALIKAIEELLGWNNISDAFLVGVGNLGSALLGYDFSSNGIHILAAFDTDERKIGSRINDKKVFSLNNIKDLAERMKVKVGIITVPAQHAQSVADLMLDAGFEAIWNFAAVPLKVPEDILVENVRLSTSLAILTNRLKEKYKK
jgi:redox-sensing transcriptional repressor